jgi:hypothetical protein
VRPSPEIAAGSDLNPDGSLSRALTVLWWLTGAIATVAALISFGVFGLQVTRRLKAAGDLAVAAALAWASVVAAAQAAATEAVDLDAA